MKNYQNRKQIMEYVERINPDPNVMIDDFTEIYYDLGIFGDDLFEFGEWLAKVFGVEGSLIVNDFGPSDGVPPIFFRKKRRAAEKKANKYRSLTFGDLVEAANSRVWKK